MSATGTQTASAPGVWRGGGTGGSPTKLRDAHPLADIDNRIRFYDYVVVTADNVPVESYRLNVRGHLLPGQPPLPDGHRIVNHKYFVDGQLMNESLTSFIKHFHEHFDEEAHSLRLATQARSTSKYYGKTQDEIKRMWEDNRVNGTRMHEYLELFYNDMHDAGDERFRNASFAHFWRFHTEFVVANRLVPYRTELRNFDQSGCDVREELCGTCDMLYQREDDVGHPLRGNNVVIVDWKFLNEMYKTAFGGRMCAPPFHALPDCNLYHYYIQLNGYRYLLERRTSLRATDMLIVDFGASNATYQMYEVPDLQAEFADAVAVRREKYLRVNLQKRKKFAAEADCLATLLLNADAAQHEPKSAHDAAGPGGGGGGVSNWTKRLKRATSELLDVDKRLAPMLSALIDSQHAALRERMGVSGQTEITSFFKSK